MSVRSLGADKLQSTPDSELADAKTMATEVYIRVRRDIVSGYLPPDKKLRLDELRSTYNVGLSPLREALSRLASENLVIAVGQRGFRVAPVSLSELHDICRLRILLETTALRDAIRHGTVAWEAKIVASLHSLLSTRLPGGLDGAVDEWEMRHSEFHASLIGACDSPWLLRLCQTMTLQYERYRRSVITGMTLSEKLYEEIEQEHRSLSQAVLARDDKLSTQLLTNHFQHVVQLIQSSYKG